MSAVVGPFNAKSTYQFHTNPLINIDVINFIDAYTKKDFGKISILMEMVNSKTKVFYTDDMYMSILKIIKSILKIRRFVVTNYKKTKNAPTYVNHISLDLAPFDDNSVELNIKNCIYKFNIKNIIKLYKYALHNIDEYYYLSGELPDIKNPYTNIPFSVREHAILSQHVHTYYFRIRKFPPQYLANFRRSYFNRRRYEKNNHSKLLFHSITSYLLKLNKHAFKSEFMNLIDSSPFIKIRYCRVCAKRINIKNIFFNSILLYILNSNAIYNYGEYQKDFIITCDLNDIKLELNHQKNHRRMVKGRRPRLNPIPSLPNITTHPLSI